MRLLCALGRHRPEPWPRWNAGYYFSQCRRCGRDLVRTAYGAWRIPKGCKVVWRTAPPENAITAYLAPEAPTARAAYALTAPTIEEVLRALGPGIPPDIEDGPVHDSTTDTLQGDAEPTANEVENPLRHAEAEAEAPVPDGIPDFMDDGDDAWSDEFWAGEADDVTPVRAAASVSPNMQANAESGASSPESPRHTKVTRS